MFDLINLPSTTHLQFKHKILQKYKDKKKNNKPLVNRVNNERNLDVHFSSFRGKKLALLLLLIITDSLKSFFYSIKCINCTR